MLQGGDLGSAQTGTSRTAGFVLPMLQRLMTSHTGVKAQRLPRALILAAPTRELAAESSVRVYGKFLPLGVTCIFGGVGISRRSTRPPWRRRHRRDAGPPARHLRSKPSTSRRSDHSVLDEADRMLDMGFIHGDIKEIARGALPLSARTSCSARPSATTSRRWPTACSATRGRWGRTPQHDSPGSSSSPLCRSREAHKAELLII